MGRVLVERLNAKSGEKCGRGMKVCDEGGLVIIGVAVVKEE